MFKKNNAHGRKSYVRTQKIFEPTEKSFTEERLRHEESMEFFNDTFEVPID